VFPQAKVWGKVMPVHPQRLPPAGGFVTLETREASDADSPGQSGPNRGVGAVLALLVLAFFLGSTPAGNSDLWLNLATGRALAQGEFHFGFEPFTCTETHVYWVHSSWLYDFCQFLLFQSFGGTVLVVLKALLIAGLAILMVLAGRCGTLSLPSIAAALALIAMGPWFSLKPLCISFFFLAWTFWYLERRFWKGSLNPTGPKSLISFWPLLGLFAFWANIDRWFVMGLLIVLCYFVGAVVSRPRARVCDSSPLSARSLGLLLLACVAVCSLNPHHIYVFRPLFDTISSEVSMQLQRDASLRATFVTPFREVYFSKSFLVHPAGVGYWALAVGGLLSLVLRWGDWTWRWRVTYGAFFAMSLTQVWGVPFFAIVAGPILARCVAAIARRHSAFSFGAHLVHGLTFLAMLLLAVAAWPGWLQVGPYGPRGWRLEPDPAFELLGDRVRACRKQEKNVFAFSTEAANYLAWHCPELRCFANSHLHLSGAAAAKFVGVREGLAGLKLPGTPHVDWRAVLRDHDVDLVVVHGGGLGSLAMQNLFRAYEECPLLFLRGRAVLFGWRDPSRKVWDGDAFLGLTLDLKHQAFSEDNESSVPGAPARDPQPIAWWDAFWRPRVQPSFDRDEGTTLTELFDAPLSREQRKNDLLSKYKRVADLVAAGASFSASLACCSIMNASEHTTRMVLAGLDEGPSEALYLAVRCFRRALRENPDDVQSYFALAETYARLGAHTRERSWGIVLGQLRHCQMVAAYRQAATLQPQFRQAAERLSQIFRQMDYKDLALKSLRESYRYYSRSPGAGALHDQLMGKLKERVGALEEEVRLATDRFDINSQNLPVVDRADMAGQLGLVGRSLEILLRSDIAAFGAAGLEIELRLLLNTGDVEKVESWFTREHRRLLGNVKYHLFKAQLEAARGNYDAAEHAFEDMVRIEIQSLGDKTLAPLELVSLSFGQTVLAEMGGGMHQMCPAFPTFNLPPGRGYLPAHLTTALLAMNDEAESRVLQGVLAIEAGESRKALHSFQAAALYWNSSIGGFFPSPRARLSRDIAHFFLGLLKSANS